MIAQQIGENLAFINWVVLAGLAVGCFAVVLVGRFADPRATKGFLGFTSFCAGAFAFLAWLSGEAAAGPAPEPHQAAQDGPGRVEAAGTSRQRHPRGGRATSLLEPLPEATP